MLAPLSDRLTRVRPERVRRAARYQGQAWLRRLPLHRGTVLYEAADGAGLDGVPNAVFEALLSAPDLRLTHVWALTDPHAHLDAVARFADDRRVRFVRRGSPAYDAALASSEFLLTDGAFGPQFGKRPGQVYVNAWRGGPQLPAVGAGNVVRNLLASDYLLAGVDAQPYVTGLRLTNVYQGAVLAGVDAQTVVDVVFRGRRADAKVRTGFGDGRRTLLIYLGSLRPNGISASGLSLLRHLDHDRFDVTVLYLDSEDPQRVELAGRIDPRVRAIPRVGGFLAPKGRLARLTAGERGSRRRSRPMNRGDRRAVAEEWTRCLGGARFDHVIDFSGYSPLWAKVLLAGRPASFSIWQHNDLHADAERTVNGRQEFANALPGMFRLYSQADHIVSVSPALAEVNRARLVGFAPVRAFTYARNTIDADHIVRRAGGARPDPAHHTFVTAGRLSPEKNHARLIRAFAAVHGHDRRARLVILGDGPLRAHLEALVADLGLRSSVTMPGHLANPFPELAAADCFVLSSDYEGQPMVLLEALALGIPVITTEFAAVADALPPDCGIVVPRSADALAAAMIAVCDGRSPSGHFDAASYNRQAMAEFYRAIGAGE